MYKPTARLASIARIDICVSRSAPIPGVTPLLISCVPFRMERCLKSKVSVIVLYLDIVHTSVRSGKIVMHVGYVAGNVAVVDANHNLCSFSGLCVRNYRRSDIED